MYPANNELLQKPLAQSVPCVGGLNLASPKVQVSAGSLQDCMNYEVGKESGYQIASGLLRWNGTLNYAITRYYSSTYDDTNAGGNSLYVGGKYTVESEFTGTTAEIQIINIDSANNNFFFIITDGDWAEPIAFPYATTSQLYGLSDGRTVYSILRDGS